LKKNEAYTVTIDGYTSQGLGVARLPDGVVFVHQALEGERCEIQLLRVSSSGNFARVLRVLESSPKRIVPDCPIYGKCGGCALRHMSYDEELRSKAQRVADALSRIGGVALPVEILGAAAQDGYRNKVLYPVAEINGQPQHGYFRARSHELIPVERCALVPAAADRLARAVTDWMRACHVPAYDEQTQRGVVRHIYLRSNTTGENMVCIVAAAERLPHTQALIDALQATGENVASVLLCVNRRPGNAVLSDDFRTLWGADAIYDTLCGLRFRLSPRSFYQVNHAQAERLYGLAIEAAQLTGRERVLDLYCGTGTITLAMAGRAREVIGVEVIDAAVKDARANAAANGIENARFLCADAGQAAAQMAAEGLTPDVIVVDPPRKGLHIDALEAIVRMSPARLVYVSCDPATLARDVKLLTARGYHAVSAQAVDMFPRCAHVETVCLLVRRNGLHIDIDVDVEEMLQEKRGQATYPQIKEYVLEQTGLKVSSLYISQIKRKCGLDVGDSYNKPKSEDAHVPQCPPEKEKAIMDALKHFGMIS